MSTVVTDPVSIANRLRPVLHKLGRHLRRETHSVGVTSGQISLLAEIKRSPGIGVRELAALERMSSPGMSKYVARLERAGLVRRRTETTDRRRVGLELTEEGQRVLRFVLSLTHSAFAVGVLALAQFLPFTVLGLFAGVVVDRLDARRTVLATQTASMLLAAALAAIALAGAAEPWHVYAIAALQGSVQVLDAPARQALTYRMVGPAELPNAVALNAASFLAVLAALLAIRGDELHPVERTERPTILRGAREGLAYARHSPRTLVTLFVVLMLSTFCFNFNVLLPVLAKQTLHGGPAV